MKSFIQNRNLTIFNQSQFNGWDLLPNLRMITQYLQSIESVLDKALTEHPRTLVVRFDLHLPSVVDCPDYPREFDTTVITRFIESFKAQVNADLIKKRREGNRVHSCTVRYAWCKETANAAQHHYHVALLLNKDTYYGFGDYRAVNNNLAGKIYRAWASALMFSPEDILTLIHFPKDTPCYHLNVNSSEYNTECNKVFRRLSYLAKAETKEYGNRSNNFGCSRK
ncbi:inovirus Gp2 family protein [Psychromonas ossibalaenae]|uniref:inovirus Gp2 family protein n=1 Tax=Psychromonas ossibalaenae TaxID=444922 RepID=UPI000374F86A|nr:inovirus Gp2 family protein [Psychromonas ossibalaenae]